MKFERDAFANVLAILTGTALAGWILGSVVMQWYDMLIRTSLFR